MLLYLMWFSDSSAFSTKEFVLVGTRAISEVLLLVSGLIFLVAECFGRHARYVLAWVFGSGGF